MKYILLTILLLINTTVFGTTIIQGKLTPNHPITASPFNDHYFVSDMYLTDLKLLSTDENFDISQYNLMTVTMQDLKTISFDKASNHIRMKLIFGNSASLFFYSATQERSSNYKNVSVTIDGQSSLDFES